VASGAAIWDEKLRGAAKDLNGVLNASGKNRVLALLRNALASGSTNEVSAAIRRFLDSKIDALTGQGFKIGQHGFLTETPTLRMWLLDYLAQIDPAAAAEYARVILNSKDSPDEWALALRNLALGDTSADARALLSEKTGEMLQYEPWQQNPSVGFLEAFDVAVYLGGTNLTSVLAGLVCLQDNQAVAHAAFLALDRLSLSDAKDTLSLLEASPDLMAGREVTRANYFARADVRDPTQRLLLEDYLLNPALGADELEKFAGLYPNANFMVSNNLLTQSSTLTNGELRSRDNAALNVINEWLADERFQKIRPQLEQMRARLNQFTKSEPQ
jgi:hypothetical protein